MHGSYSATIPFVNPLDITTYNNFLLLPNSIIPNKKGNVLQFTLP